MKKLRYGVSAYYSDGSRRRFALQALSDRAVTTAIREAELAQAPGEPVPPALVSLELRQPGFEVVQASWINPLFAVRKAARIAAEVLP